MKTKDAVRHPAYGTQVALAKALGITQPTVSEWGEYPPALHQLRIEAITGLRAEPSVAEEYPELANAVRTARKQKRTA
jgi:DNA-binding transcriptional regulator YdaS (Cro superfamily)